MNRFGVKSSAAIAVVMLLAATACHGQVVTSTPCSLSFYRYLYNLPGEQIRPNVPQGTYVFGKQVGPEEGQASDSRPTVVKPPYEAPLYLPPSTAAPTTTTTTTRRPSTSAPLYIPPVNYYPSASQRLPSTSEPLYIPPVDYPLGTQKPSVTSEPLYIPPVDYPLDVSNAVDSSNSVSVSVPVQKADCKKPGHVHHHQQAVNSELLPPYRVPEVAAPKFQPPPPKVEPPKFQFPKFEPPKFQFPKFDPPKFQPQTPKFQPQTPKFQPQVPAFQPQSTFLAPKFAPIPQKPVALDDNDIFAGLRTQQTVVQAQTQPRYPVPTSPPQFLRPYSPQPPQITAAVAHDHENCDGQHAIPSWVTSTTTTTEAAPEPAVETRQNEIYRGWAAPAKQEPEQDCDDEPAAEKKEPEQDCDDEPAAEKKEPEPDCDEGHEEESRGVPSTDYGVVPASPSAGYSYDRPAAPLEYPSASSASSASLGYAYPKGSPSFDYPAQSGQVATALFESGKSSGAEDHGDLVILKV